MSRIVLGDQDFTGGHSAIEEWQSGSSFTDDLPDFTAYRLDLEAVSKPGAELLL